MSRAAIVRQAELKRALKAAKDAGMNPRGYSVAPDGTIHVTFDGMDVEASSSFDAIMRGWLMKRRWLPAWVSEYRDRHGKPRYRFRRKGQAQYLFRHAPGSEGFRQEYEACLRGEAAEHQPLLPIAGLPGSR